VTAHHTIVEHGTTASTGSSTDLQSLTRGDVDESRSLALIKSKNSSRSIASGARPISVPKTVGFFSGYTLMLIEQIAVSVGTSLIYHLNCHNGKDSDFYLKKGFEPIRNRANI
jgi:hypothetical protein